ncbi:hypothetical protein UYSO10_1249 [Kosakonia radicincitans]|nr:hypothetical protein UYSO10_1249 [Kosakonia radicincitans]
MPDEWQECDAAHFVQVALLSGWLLFFIHIDVEQLLLINADNQRRNILSVFYHSEIFKIRNCRFSGN